VRAVAVRPAQILNVVVNNHKALNHEGQHCLEEKLTRELLAREEIVEKHICVNVDIVVLREQQEQRFLIVLQPLNVVAANRDGLHAVLLSEKLQLRHSVHKASQVALIVTTRVERCVAPLAEFNYAGLLVLLDH